MMAASAKQDELADEELNVDNFQTHPPRDLDGNEQRFKKITVEDDVIFYSQRMIGNAVVEKDQSVYIFDKASGQLKNKKISFRTSGPKLPGQLPSNLMTKEKAELSVEGNSKYSILYYASPESDIFKIDFDRSKPIWAVTSFDDNDIASVTVIDATTGRKLGDGVPPPSRAYSITGPVKYDSSPCRGTWSSMTYNANSWFMKMGFQASAKKYPSKSDIQSAMQNKDLALFYEIGHSGGQSDRFMGGCNEFTYASEITSWLSSYPKKQFAFLANCNSLCDINSGSLSYAFRKGSNAGTTTVGYCGMAKLGCANCFTYSFAWQDTLFDYMSKGYTVKKAFDMANKKYPACYKSNNTNKNIGDSNVDNDYTGPCVLFAGDTKFRLNDKDWDFFDKLKTIVSKAKECTTYNASLVTRRLSEPIDNKGSICIDGSGAPITGFPDWPYAPDYRWSFANGDIDTDINNGVKWCPLGYSDKVYHPSIDECTANYGQNNMYGQVVGGDNQGHFCIVFSKAKTGPNRWIWCTEKGCNKQGF